MKDYNFGNYICNLREEKGYSQFQLGMLVGVSDKAVSKWENGSAKPRLKTCMRLAAVLDVPLADFLKGFQIDQDSSKEKTMEKVETIMKAAENALREKYGLHIPAAFWGRFQSEKIALADSDALLHYEFLHQLRELAANVGKHICVRGTTASSYIAWLLGATTVNPAPAHVYCEHCKKVVMLPNCKDGWDANSQKCDCGHTMIGDGHNIPFEDYFTTLNKSGIHLDIEVAPSLLPDAIRVMTEYFENIFSPIAVEFKGVNSSGQRFMLVEPTDTLAASYKNIAMQIDAEDYYHKFKKRSSITFIALPNYEHTLAGSARLDVSLTAVDRLERVYDKLYSQLLAQTDRDYLHQKACAEIAEESQKYELSFSLLLKMQQLLHSSACWIENGDALVKSGTLSLLDLPACKEDVWDILLQSKVLHGNTGYGIPLHYVESIRLGRFAFGRESVDREMLMELGVPEWFPDYIQKVPYLFPKAHSVEELIKELRNCL